MATGELELQNTRHLRLRFVVESQDLSSSDFISLFEYIDDIGRGIVERERQNLLEELGFPSELRLQVLTQTRKLAQRLPAPIQVVDISKGSWAVDLMVPAFGILGALTLKSTVFPALTEAFNQSQMRDRMIRFFRDSVFGGARKEAESILSESPSRGQLRVRSVSGTDGPQSGNPEIEVRIEVTKIYKVHLTEKDLMNNFLHRMTGGH